MSREEDEGEEGAEFGGDRFFNLETAMECPRKARNDTKGRLCEIFLTHPMGECSNCRNHLAFRAFRVFRGPQFRIQVQKAPSMTLGGVISDGTTANSLTFNSQNAAVQFVPAAKNLYTGNTTVTQGVLALMGSNATAGFTTTRSTNNEAGESDDGPTLE